MEYKTYPATGKQLVAMYPKLREIDKLECKVFGYECAEDFAKLPELSKECMIAEINGDQVAMFGHYISGCMLVYWFLATDGMIDYWRTCTRAAKAYINNTSKQYLCARPVAFVWDQHKDSLRWANLLGFKRRSGKLPGYTGTILIMEKR